MIKRLKVLRTFWATCGPWTGWLLLRSLETLVVRMEEQTHNAQGSYLLNEQPQSKSKVYYPGLLSEKTAINTKSIKRQCLSPGAMISFDINGGEAEAFDFLNKLKMVKMAVSLEQLESLAEHPASMTHASVDPCTVRRWAFLTKWSVYRWVLSIQTTWSGTSNRRSDKTSML